MYTLAGDPKNEMAFLIPLIMEYRLIDWSSGVIRAKLEGYVADVELRISSKDQVAERSYRETRAHGSKTSDPTLFENWTLE